MALADCNPGVEVEIERVDRDNWQIRYHFDQPHARWAFMRSGDDFRTARWTVTGDHVALSRSANIDYLTAGQPVDQITIELSHRDHPVLFDNQSFLPLGGEAIAIYTGQFMLAGVCEDDVPSADDLRAAEHRFRFDSRLQETVLVHGGPSTASDSHVFNPQIGAFALFGTAHQSVDAATAVFVADTIPARMSQVVSAALEDAIAGIERALGQALPVQPVLILAERTDVGDGIAFRGGVLDNQVAIEVGGGRLFSDDPAMQDMVDRFVTRLMVHEAVHLWNGDLVTNAQLNEAWMHEGSADLLSWFALIDAGLIDQEFLQERLSRALNGCIGELEGGPLDAAIERGRYGAHYSCGVLMNWRAGFSIRPTDPSAGLSQLWSELIARGLEHSDRLYTVEDFHAVLVSLGADARLAAWIDSVRQSDLDDPAGFVLPGLADAGWVISGEPGAYRVALSPTP
ncbi:M1 family aminopeptidase [Maricaulis sp.]|uniref:M1 family aminopeptidase n=1 Tax=Maricaulis sp. TaxID=1486257 RepID=UPI002626D99F|nr:M1 family aminopeptidase [Maricaulis sp.]